MSTVTSLRATVPGKRLVMCSNRTRIGLTETKRRREGYRLAGRRSNMHWLQCVDPAQRSPPPVLLGLPIAQAPVVILQAALHEHSCSTICSPRRNRAFLWLCPIDAHGRHTSQEPESHHAG